MSALIDLVADPAKRQEVLRDALRVLDEEVSSKGGFGGMAVKAAYSMAKGIAPGIIQRVLDKLLNEFVGAIDPFVAQAKAQDADISKFLIGKGGEVANALLAITDARAGRNEGGALKKGYEKLRPAAQKHVEQAIPRLAELVKKYAG